MKERPGNVATPASALGHWLSLCIPDLCKWFVEATREQACIMKFVPAHCRSCRPNRIAGGQSGFAIAEMQFTALKTGRVAKQAGHGMTHTISIFEAFAEHHIAAALAMNRPG